MSKKCSRKLNNRKGFTLAELLIVIGITGILLAISMVALINYAKALKLAEMDTTAKEVFVAAQNHLTAADASGRIDGADEFGEFITEDGYVIPDDYADEKSEAERPDFEEEYHYLIYTPNGKNAGLTDSFLNCLLPFGAIDEGTRSDGAYVIEYSPENADVYGVFYTDDFDNINSLSAADVINITKAKGRHYSDEGKDARKGYDKGIIGYYGGAMADRLLAQEVKPLSIAVDNGDILTVRITDSNYFDKVNARGAAVPNDPLSGNNSLVTQGSGRQLKTSVTLKVTGDLSGREAEITLPLGGTSASPEANTGESTVTCKNPEKTSGGSPKAFKYWTVNASDGNDTLIYEINLDDISQKGSHFADLFPDFIPGEDVTVQAFSSSAENGAISANKTEPVSVNSLFANVIPGEDAEGDTVSESNATAELSCGRHLENLDDKISYISRADSVVKYPGGDSIKAPLVTYAAVVDDIDWDNWVSRIRQDIVKAENRPARITAHSKSSMSQQEEGTYYPIKRNNLDAVNGNGHTISNIVVVNEETNDGGTAYNSDGGLIRAVYGDSSKTFSFKNLILKDFEITAYKNAGALFGQASNSIASLTIEDVIVDGGTIISKSAGASAAGLFGFCNARKLVIDNCGATVLAVNMANAGSSIPKASGFIGQINGNNNTITNSYSGGHTEGGRYVESDCNVKAPDGYAGGFVAATGGDCVIKMDNCFNACSASGKYAGGFIGYRLGTKTAEISDSYSISPVVATAANGGGTLIGGMTSNTTSSVNAVKMDNDVYYLEGINGLMKAFGSANSDGSAGSKSFSGLKNIFGSKTSVLHSSKEHKSLDKTLDGKLYPFATFTREVQKKGDNSTRRLIYYGDWLNNQVSGTNIMAYRETVTEDVNGEPKDVYYWHTLGYELTDNGVVFSGEYNDLITEKGKYISEYCYGLLLPATSGNNNINSQFTQNGPGIKNFINTSNPDTVTINGENYYFYQLNGTAVRGKTTTITTPEWRTGSGNTATVQFDFNPAYGNAMDVKGQALSYEVRTQQQLDNVGVNLNYAYQQTCDIKLQGVYGAPVIRGNFTGTYDAATPDGQRYSIADLEQTVSWSTSSFTKVRHSGIFEQISGKVNDLVVENAKIDHNSASSVSLGILAGQCNGEINNCSARGAVSVAESDSDYGIGLLVGTAGENAVISRCSSGGTIDLNSQSDLNGGGLVGKIGKGRISQCWSNTTIKDRNYSGMHELGGLIGFADVQSDVSNSYAVTDFNAPGEVGLLIGKCEDSSVSKCHGALKKKNSLGVYELTVSNKPFIEWIYGDENRLSENYMLSSNAGGLTPGIKSIDTPDKYRQLASFTGFNTDSTGNTVSIWEIVSNGVYPTLINNPEEED